MRTFGKEWYSISNSPIPTALMNGSQLGYIVETKNANFSYEEIEAFPLTENEINEVFITVQSQLADGITGLLIFYYPRKWDIGEIIRTPVKDKIPAIQKNI